MLKRSWRREGEAEHRLPCPSCPPGLHSPPQISCPWDLAHLVIQLLGPEGELHVAVVPRDLLRDDLR